MKHIILGTAGHVDHGKTALVKALTGVDTDRLKEEKERGITIELGFASLDLPGGGTVGVVDVPGHERFIKNMVSGAAGIDLVMMVVAADEGIMPQTREHLHICSLLGIRKGLVALTKVDLVDDEWRELVADDIRNFLKGTFMEDAPILPVSALTGSGLPELLQALAHSASEIGAKSDAGLFRLPVDRVFSIRGFGTVATGTLVSGSIAVGEEVAILPGRIVSRVRGLQIHNHSVSEAESGQRTAVNLQGIERAAIERGNVLTRPGALDPTRRLDVFFEYLPGNDRKMKNRALVRFHAGTSELMARLTLLDRDEIEPGGKAYAQLFLAAPAVAMAGDRFVVRSYSPVTTVGGGQVIDPLSRKHKRRSEGVIQELDRLHHGSEPERLAVIIGRASFDGIDPRGLVIRTGLPAAQVRKGLDLIFSRRQAVLLDREETRAVAPEVYEELQQRTIGEIRVHHEKFPLREGLSREELRMKLGAFIGPKLFHAAMRDLEKAGKIVTDRENIRLPDHRVSLQDDQESLRREIAEWYRQAGLAPPSLREVTEKFAQHKSQIGGILNVMLKNGTLTKINEDLCFDAQALQRLREDYKNRLLKDGKATPATFKELTGLTRKYIIPLMEYFDATKLTVRSGDHRLLRERGAEMNGTEQADGLVRCPVHAFDGRVFSGTTADIVQEMPLRIYLNGRHIVTTACTGLHVEELAVGFLRSEGLIRSRDEIQDIQTAPDRTAVRIDAVTTDAQAPGNGGPGKAIASSGGRGFGRDPATRSGQPAGKEIPPLGPDRVLDLMEKFLDVTNLHRITRGTHCAALADGAKILVSREDIGRHNALDMLAGHALLHGMDCRDKIVLRTGRVSSEIVQKVRQMGPPVVVSLAVPTSLAIQQAEEAGITLVGAVRGRTFKVYTQERRMGL